MLLSYTATNRQDLPANPLQPPRSIVYFAYIISNYFKTVFHSFFLPFLMMPWKAAIAVDTKRAGSSFGAQTRLSVSRSLHPGSQVRIPECPAYLVKLHFFLFHHYSFLYSKFLSVFFAERKGNGRICTPGKMRRTQFRLYERTFKGVPQCLQ